MKKAKKFRKIVLVLAALLILFTGILIVYHISNKENLHNTNQDNNSPNEKQNINKTDNFTLKFISNVQDNSDMQKITTYNERNIYYYKEGIELYICSNKDCITLKEALDSQKITLENLYDKKISDDKAYEGGSKIIYFDDFNIVDCRRIGSGINDVINNDIIIGDKSLNNVDICK